MDFREAIMAMKQGERIARVEWPKDHYLTLVFIAEDGDMSAADDYLENRLGIVKPVQKTRIDRYVGNQVDLSGWMATPEDMQGQWRLWVQYH